MLAGRRRPSILVLASLVLCSMGGLIALGDDDSEDLLLCDSVCINEVMTNADGWGC